MNLKTKFIVLSAGLAAFAQAQDVVPTETGTTEVVAADTVADTVADTAATTVPEANVAESAPTDSTAQGDVTAQPAEAAAASEQTAEVAATEPTADSTAKIEEAAPADTAKTETPAEVPSEAISEVAATAPAADSTAAESKPAAAEPKAAHALDILHGNAYNAVGNEAASATIGSDLAMPHKMAGHKLGYIEPIEGYGVASFGENSTYFLAFDNSQNLGLVTAGYANSVFGAALKVAFGKNWYSIDNEIDGSKQEGNSSASGSLIGAVASTKIGNLEIGIDVEYRTPEEQAYVSTNDAELEFISWDLGGKATVANYSDSKFVWAANLSFLRHDAKTKAKAVTSFVGPDDKDYVSTYKSTVSDTLSRVEIIPEFNVASTVLESEMARLHIGLNAAVPVIIFDRIEGIVSHHNEYGLELVPNILGEVTLGKYVMAFGGASYQWNVVDVSDVKKNGVTSKNTKTETGTTTANLGMRFHMEHTALELSFTKQFLRNPFGSFSNTDDIGVSLGAFILF